LYVLAGHAEHVRAAVLVSALILKPAAHVVCAVHDVLRWPASWYVLAGHAEHVRFVVALSKKRWPAPHVGCAEHSMMRWSVASWYVLAGHAEHVRAAVVLSAEISWPAPHVVCAVHDRAPPVAYSLAPHSTRGPKPVHSKPAGQDEHVRSAVVGSARLFVAPLFTTEPPIALQRASVVWIRQMALRRE